MRIAVVGGGITGLTLAEGLLEKRHQVVLFEQGLLGGLAAGFALPGCDKVYLEKYYHHFFTGDRELVKLIEKHGLGSDIIWRPTVSGIYAQGKPWVLGHPMDLMSCAPVGNYWQRFMMGLNILYFKRLQDWNHLDGIRCREFFESRFNKAAYHNFWEKMLKAKFAEHYDDVPAAFLWGRIHPRSSSRSKGHEALGYLRGGFQRLICAIKDYIQARNGAICEGTPVLEIKVGPNPEVICQKGSQVFDKVIWTGPMQALPLLIKDTDTNLARISNTFHYMGVTCLVLVMKRKQGDIYWLNNIDPAISFGVVIEHTNLVPSEDYGGKHVLYVANYHSAESILSQLSDKEVLDFHFSSLQKVFPDFKEKDIDQARVFRDTHSCPVYDLYYSKRMPCYEGWSPNLDICGMTQVYPEDRNMNNCVRNAYNYLNQ